MRQGGDGDGETRVAGSETVSRELQAVRVAGGEQCMGDTEWGTHTGNEQCMGDTQWGTHKGIAQCMGTHTAPPLPPRICSSPPRTPLQVHVCVSVCATCV